MDKWKEYEKYRERLDDLYWAYFNYWEMRPIYPSDVRKEVDDLLNKIEELEKLPEIRKKIEERARKFRENMEKYMEKYKEMVEKCSKEKSPEERAICILQCFRRTRMS